ncbi:MAG: hypothetical protein KF761_12920 [Salinibacterium sp.]|nr:hypothetical protein [Salinibacterium sp.]
MTVLGVVTLVAIVVVWFVRREWTQYVVGATVAFPQTAGLIVAGNGFPLFYLAVVILVVLAAPYALLGLSRMGRAPHTRRERLLPDLIGLALVAWSAVITVAGPRIFEGMRVFAPELGVDAQVYNMATLHPSLGNIAQLGYVSLGVIFLLVAGRTFPVDARLIGSALWVAVVLAAVRIVAEPVWPHALLQNMPSFHYATPERLSGTFYEPSVLGLYLTAAAGYFGARLLWSGRAGRVAAFIALVLVAVDFVRNGSGTALLGLAILLALAGVVGLVRQLRSRRFGVRPLAIVGAVALIGGGLTQIPVILQLTVGSAATKADSDSFIARTASNVRSWNIFLESVGLGIGLGGNRPSSLVLLILSCLGIVGFALVTVLVVLALKRALAHRPIEPAGWGLAGVLVAAIVAIPDLSTPAIWIGLAACLYTVVPLPDPASLRVPTAALHR